MVTRQEINKEKIEEIENEQKKEQRKKIVKTFLKFTFILIISMTTIYTYITYISNQKIITKEYRIIEKELPDNFNGLKIIHFSDLKYKTTINKENLKELIKEINLRKPDLVFFTGDLINKNYDITSKEQEELINELKKINTTMGKYAISGDEDKENYTTIMNQSDFIILNNESDLIYNKNNNPILLIGLNSSLKNERNIDNAYNYFNEDSNNKTIYTICLLHETDSIDEITSKYKTNLFLDRKSVV